MCVRVGIVCVCVSYRVVSWWIAQVFFSSFWLHFPKAIKGKWVILTQVQILAHESYSKQKLLPSKIFHVNTAYIPRWIYSKADLFWGTTMVPQEECHNSRSPWCTSFLVCPNRGVSWSESQFLSRGAYFYLWCILPMDFFLILSICIGMWQRCMNGHLALLLGGTHRLVLLFV